MVGRRLLFVASALLGCLWAAPAAAEPVFRWPPPMQLVPVQDSTETDDPIVDDWELREDERSAKLPRFRLEANFRFMSVYGMKTKVGPAEFNHTTRAYRDAHLPMTPTLGYRVLLDVKFTRDFVIGGFYTNLFIDGPRRHIHHRGIAYDNVNLAPASLVRTSVEIQWGDVFFRYVARDSDRLRFIVGLGLSWASFRIHFTGYGTGTKGRVEAYFAGSFGYLLQVRLIERLHVFIEGTTSLISVDKFPAYLSDSRIGFRIPLIYEIELMIAFVLSSGQLENLDDLWGGKRVRSGHRWRQASWASYGMDVGMAVRF